MTAMTGLRPGPGSLIVRSGLVWPVGAWALVVPGSRVVAPFPDLGAMASYAADLAIPPETYRVLPFYGRGVIATL
ncbi:hypothetical protein ACG83_08220 [Frankia sp. R43]|uniref:hypothetical protein n=1 Tax=Frankia sp. R43 TaxID=269536 RepID=UPI0006DA2FD2|nr:hypothetical protein [Frankia sp. R43]KPM55363.1 hypothetical protein ACG83_08220 [Frankia sp. R43]